MVAAVARPRSPALRPLVESLTYVEAQPPEGLERVLPTARIHLMVNLDEDEFRMYDGPAGATVRRTGGAVLEGPQSRPRVIDTRMQRRLISVDFALGGAAPFFGPGLSETGDQLVDLDRLWGRDAAVLRERLLEAAGPAAKLAVLESVLLDHLAGARRPDAVIGTAAGAIERGASIAEAAGRAGVTERTLVRRFREQAGLTPKRYSRVRRLQRLLLSIGDPGAADWADLAARHGYADQAHLIHEFRALTGLTPTAYRPRSERARNHAPVEPPGG
jgi:AraC-like DNA-binding protein